MKFKLSEKAKTQLASDPNVTKAYRITVLGIGWGGPTFGLVRDEQKENDYFEEIEGIKLMVDRSLVDQFGGFNIDYSGFWLTKGFFISAFQYGSRC